MTRTILAPLRPLLPTLLALSLPSAALAQDGEAAPAPAAETQVAATEEPDEWAALDRELAGMETLQLDDGRSNIELWGYIRSSLYWLGPSDEAGVNLDAVRLNFTGRTGDYDYRLTGEFFDGTGRILDAWVSTGLGEEVAFTIGRFRAPFLRSGLIEARDLLFILRTRNGFFYARRDASDDGVMVNGDHGRFHWALASQNGALINDSSQRVTGSVRVNLIGQRELPWEGAYRAGDQTRLTAGIAVSDDDSVSEGLAWNADLYLIHQRFSFAAEIVDYEEGYSLDVPLEQRGDTTPWSATASYMLVPETYEVALRYDDFDDRSQPLDYDRKLWTVGLNRYIRGHELKWQLNYAYFENGGSTGDDSGSSLALGLTASF